MTRNAGEALDADNMLGRHLLPLGNGLGSDATESLGQGGGTTGDGLSLFAEIFHAPTESITFTKMQANLSMKDQLSSGNMPFMAKKPTAEDRAIGERIKYVREVLLEKMPQDVFGAKLGVSRGAVGNWELGKGIGKKNEHLICTRFGVPYEWLALGRGPRPEPGDINPHRVYLREDEVEFNEPSPDSAYFRENYKPKMDGGIPECDVAVGAGEGKDGEILAFPIGDQSYSGHKILGEWVLSDDFLTRDARVAKNSTIILPVVGDSMFPNYMHGDRVLVDLSQNKIPPDSVYVYSDGNSAPQIKRLQRVPNSNPIEVEIISDNSAYKIYTRQLSEITVLGRVCGVIARR